MQTKAFLKILLLSINFQKFNSMNLASDQSQQFKRSTMIGPSIFNKFIEVNISKLTHSKQFFGIDSVCINYHHCKISYIIECKIFAPNDLIEINSL